MVKMEISTTERRITALILLLTLLAGLCLYYHETYEAHQYPDTEAILKNYPTGETVSVSGKVTSIFNGGFKLEDDINKNVIYTVSSSHPVLEGDMVRISGILGSDYQISASRILVTPRWSNNFMLLRSLLAAIFLAWLFNHYWKFSTEKMEFQRRRK